MAERATPPSDPPVVNARSVEEIEKRLGHPCLVHQAHKPFVIFPDGIVLTPGHSAAGGILVEIHTDLDRLFCAGRLAQGEAPLLRRVRAPGADHS